MKRLVLILILFVLSVLALAQEAGRFDGPRQVISAFLDAAQDGDFPAAAETLDAEGLDAAAQASITKDLSFLLQRRVINLDTIPDRLEESEFNISPVLDAEGQKVGDLLIRRLPNGQWKFAKETVDKIAQMATVGRKREASKDALWSDGPLRGPEHLATPQRTMTHFFRSAQAGRWGDAAEALDLGDIPVLSRQTDGKRLAAQLLAILNRSEIIPITRLPDKPLGPPYVLIKFPEADNKSIDLDVSAEGSWRITPASIDRFDAIWLTLRDKPILGGRLPVSEQEFDPAAGIRRSMPEPLRRTFLGVGGWQWAILGCAFLVSLLAGWLGWLTMRTALRRIDRKEPHLIGLVRRQRVARSAGAVVASLCIQAGVNLSDLPSEVQGVIDSGLTLIVASMVVLLTWSVWSAFCDWLTGHFEQRGVKGQRLFLPFLMRLGQAVIFIGVLIAALSRFGVNVTTLIAGLGLGGIVIGLAAKDTVENVFGSFTILLERSFAIGDWIKVGDVEGTVEDISLRSIRIRTFTDSLVILPNNRIITGAVENMGQRRSRRMRVLLQIPPGTPAQTILTYADGLREFVLDRQDIKSESLVVRLNDMSPSGPQVLLNCYLEVVDYENELLVRQEILVKALELSEEMGFTIGVKP